MRPVTPRWSALLQGLVALIAIGVSLWSLRASDAGITTRTLTIMDTPVTVHRSASGAAGPAVLIAHGFAGSQQLMQSFAATLARNGYVAVTFDFAGHGRNPTPLAGNITREDGATRTLVAETSKVAGLAHGLGDGRLAVLGHSMATDIVVRFAKSRSEVAATVAVSMFSPAVTAAGPKNLLVIVGDWESALKREALRAVSLVSSPAVAEPGVTYGDVTAGTARRAAFSPHVEHVGVLYSRASLHEAVSWLDATFGITRAGEPDIDGRGPSILLLLLGAVLLARPLSRLLPVVSDQQGAGLGWRQMWLPLVLPAIATPLVLRVLPTHFLPVLVGDYLTAHFALYGALTATCLILDRRRHHRLVGSAGSRSRLALASAAMILYGLVAIAWPIDTYVTSFWPGRGRLVLVTAMLVGTLSYFLADEWLTRGRGSARGAYAASKAAFLLSLALAVALDLERLFFLLIIVPVIVLFFVVYGLFSAWAYRRTGHPLVAGIANAVAFAWAIGVTFPLLAG